MEREYEAEEALARELEARGVRVYATRVHEGTLHTYRWHACEPPEWCAPGAQARELAHDWVRDTLADTRGPAVACHLAALREDDTLLLRFMLHDEATCAACCTKNAATRWPTAPIA